MGGCGQSVCRSVWGGGGGFGGGDISEGFSPDDSETGLTDHFRQEAD